MEEIWKPVPGFEGKYEVSNLGRVRSLDRKVQRIDGQPQGLRGRLLKPRKNNKGSHLYVVLYKNGGKDANARGIHRLVLEAFLGPAPRGLVCCHNNGDPTDNNIRNLRWDSHANNIRDRKWHLKENAKSCCQKLTPDEIRFIRQELQAGVPQAQVAKIFGLNQSTVQRIKARRIHADV